MHPPDVATSNPNMYNQSEATDVMSEVNMSWGTRTDPKIIERIRELRRQRKLTIDQILSEVDECSRSTVAKYVREFENMSELEQAQYSSLNWNRIDDYGFSPDTKRFLFLCWGAKLGAPLTPIEARWISHVYQLQPQIPPLIALYVAAEFMLREIEILYNESVLRLQAEPNNDDLYYWIAFMGWREDSGYEQAVNLGVPRIDSRFATFIAWQKKEDSTGRTPGATQQGVMDHLDRAGTGPGNQQTAETDLDGPGYQEKS
jgi:transcriptional regulator with XRE-family HTH domain